MDEKRTFDLMDDVDPHVLKCYCGSTITITIDNKHIRKSINDLQSQLQTATQALEKLRKYSTTHMLPAIREHALCDIIDKAINEINKDNTNG